MRKLFGLGSLATLSLAALFATSCSGPSARVEGAEENTAPREVASAGKPEDWAYDGGPDPKSAMGRELIDLNSEIPNFPELSEKLLGDQKFRPVYGPIPWRMLQKPNSVKMLFIGQDGTHIAEAAGRPATAGFGGRAQDLARYFGVSWSAAFINAYAFTIKGQYGAFETPFVRNGQMQYGGFVDNTLWLMSNDQDSPLVKWRNDLIDWIIRNNRDSLKMVVLFGGAARDAAATFVESRGGKVGTRFSEADMQNIQIPESYLVSAGGNNEAPVPYDRMGRDLYAKVLGRRINYMPPRDQKKSADLAAAQERLKNDFAKYEGDMVFSRGGPYGNGLLHPGQLGGFDIDNKMEIGGKKTISLRGLKLSDGRAIANDIVVVQLPHPTALSMMDKSAASKKVAADLEGLKPYVRAGWKIEADEGFSNEFAAGRPYSYGRAGMHPAYYDFGAPASRMVDVSTAARAGQNVIIFGTRDKGGFDGMDMKRKLREMTDAKPSRLPSSEELWTMRPRSRASRYVFDEGPGEKYAKIMKTNIPAELIKKHHVNEDYAHYRGTFDKPQVLIVADPHGYDDLITARALTGTRGQYLHGLMEDLGVKEKYLVIKTAPFSREDAKEWGEIVEKTKRYREELLSEILRDSRPELILTDGDSASAEVRRILGSRSSLPPIVEISRGASADSGIAAAGESIKKAVPAFSRARVDGKMSDIPRSHLSYYARIWEGTSGDRVISTDDPKFKGTAFAEVAPAWAYKQRQTMESTDQQGLRKLIDKLDQGKLRRGGETIPQFLRRHPSSSDLWTQPTSRIAA